METFIFDVGDFSTKFGYSIGPCYKIPTPLHILSSQSLNFDNLQQIWNECIEGIESNEIAVLYTVKDQLSSEDKKSLLQLFFEGYNVPSFYMYNQSACIMHDSGILNGYAIDLGSSGSSILPFENAKPLEHLSCRLEHFGSALDHMIKESLPDYFLEILKKYPHQIPNLKKDLFYWSTSYDHDCSEAIKDPSKFSKAHVYQRQDYINFTEERFKIPQIFFEDFVEKILNVVQDTRISNDIVIAGGLSQLNGFMDRLQMDIKMENSRLKLIQPNEPELAVWRGASLFSLTTFFENESVRRSDYDEFGSDMIAKMF